MGRQLEQLVERSGVVDVDGPIRPSRMAELLAQARVTTKESLQNTKYGCLADAPLSNYSDQRVIGEHRHYIPDPDVSITIGACGIDRGGRMKDS